MSSFQLREEWDFSDEKLQDLKRIQKRMSASSITNPSLSHKRTDTGDRHRRKTRTMLPWYVVHPNARIKMVWDTLAIFAICLEICVSPLLLYRLTEMERSIADIFQWTLTAFWTLDIIASFFTATYVNDNLCFRLAEIAKAYLKSWFLFDITMLIPDFVGMAFDLEDGPAGIFRLLKARRILRLFRFVQILKVRRLLDRFQTARFKMRVGIGPLATPLLSATLVLVLAVHVLGSLWFAVGDTEKGWVRAEGLHTAGLGRQISRSLEWALSKLPPSSLRITVELQTPG